MENPQIDERAAMRIAEAQKEEQIMFQDPNIIKWSVEDEDAVTRMSGLPPIVWKTASDKELRLTNIDKKGQAFIMLGSGLLDAKARMGIPPTAISIDQDLKLASIYEKVFVGSSRSIKGFERTTEVTQMTEKRIVTPEQAHRGFRVFGRFRGPPR